MFKVEFFNEDGVLTSFNADDSPALYISRELAQSDIDNFNDLEIACNKKATSFIITEV